MSFADEQPALLIEWLEGYAKKSRDRERNARQEAARLSQGGAYRAAVARLAEAHAAAACAYEDALRSLEAGEPARAAPEPLVCTCRPIVGSATGFLLGYALAKGCPIHDNRNRCICGGSLDPATSTPRRDPHPACPTHRKAPPT